MTLEEINQKFPIGTPVWVNQIHLMVVVDAYESGWDDIEQSCGGVCSFPDSRKQYVVVKPLEPYEEAATAYLLERITPFYESLENEY